MIFRNVQLCWLNVFGRGPDARELHHAAHSNNCLQSIGDYPTVQIEIEVAIEIESNCTPPPALTAALPRDCCAFFHSTISHRRPKSDSDLGNDDVHVDRSLSCSTSSTLSCLAVRRYGIFVLEKHRQPNQETLEYFPLDYRQHFEKVLRSSTVKSFNGMYRIS